MASSVSGPAAHADDNADRPPPQAERAPREVVLLREHDPAWPAIGAQIVARLRPLLGERAVAVEHIGSTAVPGLLAKPIIDIAVGVVAKSRDLISLLESDGWIYVGERPDDDGGTLLVTETTHHHRVAHLHVVQHNGSEWRRYLAFREGLRRDPDLREAYARLKRELAAAHPRDRNAYTEGKSGFVLGSTGIG
jgi:GrpB-like predicted nucleotidyltransferase (UPF0157 family)